MITTPCRHPHQIEQLMPEYFLEMSRYTEEPVTTYPYLDFYWRDPDRYPLLIQEEKEICGFSLVRRIRSGTEEPDTHSIAEFYVQSGQRRQGVGGRAVKSILEAFPGPWLIQVLIRNQPAYAFWHSTLTNILGSNIEPTQGERFYDFRFDY